MKTNESTKSNIQKSFWLNFLDVCEVILIIFATILGLIGAIAIIAAIDKLFCINCLWITFLLFVLLNISPSIGNRYSIILFVIIAIFVFLDFSIWKSLLLFLVSSFIYLCCKFQSIEWIIMFIPLGICSAHYAWGFNWIISIVAIFVLIASEKLIDYLKNRFLK